MERNKKLIVRFGAYSKRPEEDKPNEMYFPEDTLFFTGGESEIGECKHQGAFHVLAMTKASDKEIKAAAEQGWGAHVVNLYGPHYKNIIFRVNGYAFIELSDCISDEFVFTDIDKINELLDLKNHPIYVVLLNDEYMISDVSRIDRINSYYNVDTVSLQLYSQLGSRYFPMIWPKNNVKLANLIHPFHKFSVYIPEESYGKELFDEVLYIAMGHVYPEYNKKLKGFDMEYINRKYKEHFDYWNDCLQKLKDNGEFCVGLLSAPPPQLENIKDFIEKIPLKDER